MSHSHDVQHCHHIFTTSSLVSYLGPMIYSGNGYFVTLGIRLTTRRHFNAHPVCRSCPARPPLVATPPRLCTWSPFWSYCTRIIRLRVWWRVLSFGPCCHWQATSFWTGVLDAGNWIFRLGWDYTYSGYSTDHVLDCRRRRRGAIPSRVKKPSYI
jgi:hypothetical protein